MDMVIQRVEKQKPEERPASADGPFQQIVFKEELNEVYLLLDFISGRPERKLSDLDGKVWDPDLAPDQAPLSAAAIVKRVSRMRYPPEGNQTKVEGDAAFLMLLKDALNTVAYPARGLTIAYSILFAEAEEDAHGKGAQKTDRLKAAELAFPGLVASARMFRSVKTALVWSGLAVTIVSAVLLWQVTYGSQLAARFDEAKKGDTTSAAEVYTQAEREHEPKSAVIGDMALPSFCRINGSSGAPAQMAGAGGISAAMRQKCDEFSYRHAVFCEAIADVSSYGQFWMFKADRLILPVHEMNEAKPCDDASGGTARQEDAQSVAGVLAVMSNYLLPILFGLAGTMAALMRNIQDKVTESLLAPRDQALSLIRLPLGMVAGICIGLFLTPSGVGAQANGSFGLFTMSASGIAFLAGYGAESVFRLLDALIGRVFVLEPPARPAR